MGRMSRVTRSLLAVGLLALIASLTSGCGSEVDDESTPRADAATPAEPAESEGNGADAAPTDVTDAEGGPERTSDGGATMPDGFPRQVPIYPDAVPLRSRDAEVDDAPVSAVQLRSEDGPETVVDYYVESLEGDGWSVETSDGIDDSRRITASRDDCRLRVLTAPARDGGADILVVTECKAS
jgi:hypothetical protein